MTSLSDVYEGGINTVADPRQRRLGGALFTVGTVMVVASIAIATTDIATWLGHDVIGARKLAGMLAGLGIPTAFVGLFAVLPATNTMRATGAIGASLAVFGVVLFRYAYPDHWLAADPAVTLTTIAIYSLGTLLTLWSVFISVATFTRRNAPGGTAHIELTKQGNVRVVSSEPEKKTGGSVGLFGSEPNGTVPTQTNNHSQPEEKSYTDQSPTTSSKPQPAGDGSGVITDDALVDDDILQEATQRGKPDRYCGNCEHFQYVRADGEITPYCGLRNELMEDMDACEEWDHNA